VKKLTVKDVDIIHDPQIKQIVLPSKMTEKEAIEWLERKDRENDKEIAVHYEIDCFPLDGAVALRKALDTIYGFVQSVATPTWFGDQPPVMIGVPIGPPNAAGVEETVQVPWGRINIPGVSGYLNTSMATNPHPKFIVNGKVKQRHKEEIADIITKTKEFLKTHSIYKGKAIRLDLSWKRNGQNFDPMVDAPKFTIPTEKVVEEDLIFPAEVQMDIELGLFTPIEQADHCRKHGIPLKRGVLLAGPYGCGKTLTAFVTAKKAIRNGFTFIYLSNVLDLAAGLKFAAQYAPAVLFAEDVDRTMEGDTRTEKIDTILNQFDGVDTKNGELITVLTTNHPEKLSQAILRPGRIDTLVVVAKPDAAAAARLVHLYGRGLINKEADFQRIGEALADHIPAEIREAVERAKLAAIRRLSKAGQLPPDGSIEGHVLEQDVLTAVHAMKAQHKLLQPKNIDKRTPVEKCAHILGNTIADAINNGSHRNAAVAVRLLQEMGLPAYDVATAAQSLRVTDDVHVSPNGEDVDDENVGF